MSDIPVKCTRCRHKCMESDWIAVPMAGHPDCREHTCPRCGCRSYYNLTPLVAWCWASGLIEIGEAMPADGPDGGGAIQIATGPSFALRGALSAVARHGQGASAGKLLVPGIPEAEDEVAKADALAAWLAWCGKRKSPDGVQFAEERS